MSRISRNLASYGLDQAEFIYLEVREAKSKRENGCFGSSSQYCIASSSSPSFSDHSSIFSSPQILDRDPSGFHSSPLLPTRDSGQTSAGTRLRVRRLSNIVTRLTTSHGKDGVDFGLIDGPIHYQTRCTLQNRARLRCPSYCQTPKSLAALEGPEPSSCRYASPPILIHGRGRSGRTVDFLPPLPGLALLRLAITLNKFFQKSMLLLARIPLSIPVKLTKFPSFM